MSAHDDRPPGARRAFRLPVGAQRDRHLDDELRFHLEERVDELMARGRTRAEAEAEVAARFGTLERWRQETRAIDDASERRRRRLDLRDTLGRELPRALRTLARAPGFAIVTVLTLALGIGATTAIAAVLDRVVLRPLPYPAADRLVTIEHAVPMLGANERWKLASVNFYDFRAHVPAIARLGIYVAAAVNVEGEGGVTRADAAVISASVLETFRVRALHGRLLAERDNAPGAPGVAVLGHDYWQRRFGGDPAVVGRTISVEATPTEVVGVLPPDVHLPTARADVWLPLTLDSTRVVNQHTYAAVARLADDATPDALLAQLRDRERRFAELYPRAYHADFFESTGFTPIVTPLRDAVVGPDVVRTLWIVLAAVGLVFAVGCAHVANLFLVRVEARRRETAVRAALGASRADLARHAVTESLLLAGVAAVLAVALAWAAVRVLVRLAPAGLPRIDEIALGPAHVAVAATLALAVGAAFGLLPLLRAGPDLATLRDGGRGMTASRARGRVRGALVVAQVALSLVLLAAGALMLQSALRLRAVPPGFDAANVATFQVPLPYATYPWGEYARVARLHRALQARLAAVPGVVAVGGTRALPMLGDEGCGVVVLEEPAANGRRGEACLPNATVAPGYFDAMRIPLLRGAAPTWDDVEAGRAGVVVSRSLAERLWPGQDPIGRGLRPNGDAPPFMRVVGVAGDVRMHGLTEPPTEMIYFPMVPNPGIGLWDVARDLRVVVRTETGDAASVLAAAREAMAELDPSIPLDDARSMRAVMEASLSRSTLAVLLLATAAAMALLLSGIGIYGVVSYLVAQRRAEIGVRMALGAAASRVRRDVVWGSVRLALAGVALGLVGAVLATRLLGALLYDVSPTDPVTLLAVAALLVVLAAVASWVPAVRASRVDPTEALRG